MANIQLTVLGSTTFSNILNELEFDNILKSKNRFNHSDKELLVKILFVENLSRKEIKNYLQKNEPIILFLNNKN